MDDPKTQTIPPGAFVNFLRVALAPSEFHLAFAQRAPGPGQAAHLVASLVTTPIQATPIQAKAMLKALGETIERYEQQFGEIPVIEPEPEPKAARPAAKRSPAAERAQKQLLSRRRKTA